jgi:3-hydroxyanthranilate 3,4-dioxygenase
MERKKMLHTLQEARGCLGSYDEFPTLPEGTDPMPHLSRNRVAQPFFLISETDRVILALAGQTTLLVPGATPPQVDLALGEAVYVPAGQANRLIPRSETVLLTYKAEPPGWEAAVWYCAGCGTELFRHEINTAEQLAQDGYWAACQAFNTDPRNRRCAGCATDHPPVDLADIHWPEVAERIRASSAPRPDVAAVGT